MTVSTTAGGTSTPLADAYTYNAAPTVTSVSPDNGPAAGTNSVTVNGTGFVSGSTTVDFGSNAGTSVAVAGGGDSLTVVVPSGSGTVSVTVSTTAGGTSTPLADAYTYNAAPTVTSVSPDNGPAAGTNSVTVNGTGFVSGSTTVDFGSNAGTSVAVAGGGDSLTVVVPSGSGTVSVTVITTAGGTSTPLADAYTYNGSSASGGAVTLSKATALIGNYPDKVSGTGWAANGDTTVTINQCASTAYSAATCDAANAVSVTLGTGTHAGTFTSSVIKLAVGGIDTNGDTCGLATSVPCYIVVVGNTGDSTTSAALGFTLPSITVHETTDVLGNYVDAVGTAGIPIGDTVTAQECDASVVVPGTVSTHCDAVTQISGTSGTNGKVIFNATGVTLRVGSAYTDTASGSCQVGGTCNVGVVDSDNSDINASVAVGFASPTVKVSKTIGVLGNYVEKLTAKDFPIGDTIDAVECDSSVTTANLGQNCDDVTQISGSASTAGEVTGTAWSPAGLTMLVDGAYGDGADGSCLTGGSCYVAAIDSTNSPVNALSGSIAMAVPLVKVSKTAGVLGNYVETVTATDFPIGDTIDAVECDSSVTTANLGQNCDDVTQISGSASTAGEVTGTAWSPAGLTMLVDGAYGDGADGSCLTGGSCYVAAIDSTNSPVNALSGSIGMATPTVTIVPATVATGNGRTITVTGKDFPINDTVVAVECDTAFSGSLNNCDTTNAEISGTAGATGTVVWSPLKITVLTTLTSPSYSDSSSPVASCAPGDSVANSDPCFVYTYDDTSNSAISNTSPFGVS